MADDHARLMELAEAVADLKQINWLEAESAAMPDERYPIPQLEVLARVAALHRQSADGAPGGSLMTAAVDPSYSHWGSLELRREIGKGSYATVYLAWDSRLEREVALKILHHLGDADLRPAVI